MTVKDLSHGLQEDVEGYNCEKKHSLCVKGRSHQGRNKCRKTAVKFGRKYLLTSQINHVNYDIKDRLD